MAEPTFRASGIASGIDTGFMVEELTKIQRIPLDRLKSRQNAFSKQVSALGDISSKLTALKTAASKLASSGGLGVKSVGTPTAFAATPGSEAVAGRYDVQVGSLATNARALSDGLSTGTAIKAGTLNISVLGQDYEATIASGATLNEVASAIKASGAPVSAVVLNDGTKDFLSIVRKDSGYTIGGNAADALVISADYTGSSGHELAFAITNPENAALTVNGLSFVRTTNRVTDAVPGTTLELKVKGGPVETISLENDPTKTAENLKGFVDAYNSVMKTISDNLKPAATTDRAQTLAGDSSLRTLQRSLQSVLTNAVGGLTNVRSLAEIGIKTSQADGTISVDTATLTKALDKDADALNKIFSTATSGVSAVVEDLTQRYTNTKDGILTSRRNGINTQTRAIGKQLESMEVRIEAYRIGLINQFTAMEKTLSGLKATGSFLSSQYG